MIFEAYATGKKEWDTKLLARGSRCEMRPALEKHKGDGFAIKVKEGDGCGSHATILIKKKGKIEALPEVEL